MPINASAEKLCGRSTRIFWIFFGLIFGTVIGNLLGISGKVMPFLIGAFIGAGTGYFLHFRLSHGQLGTAGFAI